MAELGRVDALERWIINRSCRFDQGQSSGVNRHCWRWTSPLDQYEMVQGWFVPPPNDSGSCLKVEKIAASEQTVGLEKDDIQKELRPSDLSSPTGIT